MDASRQFTHFHTLLLVIQEYFLHSQRRTLVIDKGVDLKVVLKGTDVEVRGASRRQSIVRNQCLGMQESCLVEIDFGTRIVQLAQIGA